LQWIEADAYLFDIDGTLLNASGGAHYRAFSYAMRVAFGLDATIDGVPWHGNTDAGILRAVCRREHITDAEFENRLSTVVEFMGTSVERNRAQLIAEVCPSVREVVELLHTRGKLLGVVSGNFERVGWVKLEAASLRDFFSFGLFSDTAEHRRDIFRLAIAEVRRRLGPSASICIVGDTPADILAARENAVPIIAVATGIYPQRELQKHAPDLCISSCKELLPLAAQVG
jgi:phosphoglycolate phosphatase